MSIGTILVIFLVLVLVGVFPGVWQHSQNWGYAPFGGVGLILLKQGKVGRNDVCPCGSGKKFKKCCLYKP